MTCHELKLPGVCLVSEEQEVKNDLGFDVFYSYSDIKKDSGLKNVFLFHYETSFTFKNTLRGFYIQDAPWTNNLMLRCFKGACRIILLDVRDTSKTYQKYISLDLSSEKNDLVYIPTGIAHAFISQEDDTSVYILSDNIPSDVKNITINAFEILAGSGLIPDGVIASITERSAPRFSEIEHRYW
jgi:dTDP-4-dehydrorhamnose 3,5-epimerase-like enzyme